MRCAGRTLTPLPTGEGLEAAYFFFAALRVAFFAGAFLAALRGAAFFMVFLTAFLAAVFRVATFLLALRTAFLIRSARTGCASVVFEPITSRKRQFSISGIELVVAPLPSDLTRP